MGLQIRGVGTPGLPSSGLCYSPQRDLAKNVPWFAEQAVTSLLPENRTPETAAYIAAAQIDDQDLARAVNALGYGLRDITDPANDDLREAFARHGFFEASAAARCVVASVLGRLLIGAFFTGIREVLNEAHPTPHPQVHLAEFVATAARVSRQLAEGDADVVSGA